MMVRFINRATGSVMWVHESRVEEYNAAGHKPAAEEQKPVKRPSTKSAKAKK